MKCAFGGYAAVLVFLMTVSSCAPKRAELVLDTEVTSAEALMKLVEEHAGRVRSLVGSGTVSFESPEISGTASFESSLKKPDSLLVKFEGPFGLDVGTFFLSREKYLLYNSFENRVVTGNPDAAAIRSLLPFDLTYEEILDAFSGVFTVPRNPGGLRSYSIEDDQFFLSFDRGPNSCDYWIDPRHLLVGRYRIRDTRDKVLVEARASSFTERDGVSVPRRIVVQFPNEHRQFLVHYAEVTINAPDPPFTFSVPPDAITTIR
jgi:outer membrane lipoprotein-sorting protein